MVSKRIPELTKRRNYEQLAEIAQEYAREGQWNSFVKRIEKIKPAGKARDALVNVLDLEAVGGTDSNIFHEFGSLSGSSLSEIRSEANTKAIDILQSQLKESNTFFIDAEMLATSPFVVLFEDVMNARLKELESIKGQPSRNDLLRTYYGFTLLTLNGVTNTTDHQFQYRRYWHRRYESQPRLAQETVTAITQIMKDFSSEIHLNSRYETLGTSYFLADKCSTETSAILADIIRLTLYMTPWDRGKAALLLGKRGDSRSLEFLHSRFISEPDMKTRGSIARAIGYIGNPNSFDLLKSQFNNQGRWQERLKVAITQGMGGIYLDEATDFLVDMLNSRSYKIKEAAVESLAERNPENFTQMIAPLLKTNSKVVLRKVVEVLLDSDKKSKRMLIESAPRIVRILHNNSPSHQIVSRLLSLKEIVDSQVIEKYLVSKINELHKKRMDLHHRGIRNWWTARRVQRYNRKLAELISLCLKTYPRPLPSYLREVIDDMKVHNQGELRIPLYNW